MKTGFQNFAFSKSSQQNVKTANVEIGLVSSYKAGGPGQSGKHIRSLILSKLIDRICLAFSQSQFPRAESSVAFVFLP